jgi:hypothetical protein
VLLSERVLLAERVVAYWLLATHLDGLISIQLHPTLGKEHRAPESFFMRMVGWQESVNKRYLSAIKELAQVRKLQSNAPGIQVNTQVNLLGGRRAVQRSAKEEEES